MTVGGVPVYAARTIIPVKPGSGNPLTLSRAATCNCRRQSSLYDATAIAYSSLRDRPRAFVARSAPVENVVRNRDGRLHGTQYNHGGAPERDNNVSTGLCNRRCRRRLWAGRARTGKRRTDIGWSSRRRAWTPRASTAAPTMPRTGCGWGARRDSPATTAAYTDAHAVPKEMFVRPLRADARERLADPMDREEWTCLCDAGARYTREELRRAEGVARPPMRGVGSRRRTRLVRWTSSAPAVPGARRYRPRRIAGGAAALGRAARGDPTLPARRSPYDGKRIRGANRHLPTTACTSRRSLWSLMTDARSRAAAAVTRAASVPRPRRCRRMSRCAGA